MFFCTWKALPNALRASSALGRARSRVEPVPLPHVPGGRGLPDGAGHQFLGRAEADSDAENHTKTWPADPTRWARAAFDREKGHADDGRGADPAGDGALHADLGKSQQRLFLGDAAGDVRLW